ncbi:MAG TPA: hypothetical protein VH724_13800 [Candidatus Angelobacter sp.]|nr:hypothetical protein [Candidatus Angelobacter sp.]
MSDPQTSPQANPPALKLRVTRVLGMGVLFLVALYTAAVLAGLKPERRIDGATLGIIGIGVLIATVLFRPDIFDRVTHIEMSGWKVDIEKKQQQQDKQLQDIELVLAILLTDSEQKHLLNLDSNNTAGYEGSHDVRTELRRLADMNLIKRRTNREIGGIQDKLKVDLADFVKLTETGHRLAERIRQINAERDAEKTKAQAAHA